MPSNSKTLMFNSSKKSESTKKTVKKKVMTKPKDFKSLQVQHTEQKNWKKPSEACVKCFQQILKSAADITVVQCGSKSIRALNLINKIQKEVLTDVKNIKVTKPKLAEYRGIDELCKKKESEIKLLQTRLELNEQEADHLEREQEKYIKLLDSVREKQTEEKQRPLFPLLNDEFTTQVDIPEFPKESFSIPVISHVPREFVDLYNEMDTTEVENIDEITKRLETVVNSAINHSK